MFWNIGQGDFITLILGRDCLIFDPGGNRRISLEMKIWFRQCQSSRLFQSHFDKDHIVHCPEIPTMTRVTDAYFSHLDPQTSTGERCLAAMKKASVKIHEWHRGEHKTLMNGAVDVDALWPPRDFHQKRVAENDRSLVLMLAIRQSANSKKILMTGDFPSREEKKLLKRFGANGIHADILKVGHHGSRHSSSSQFLRAVSASMCVISSGRGNHYGHPNPEALERLRGAHCAILRTDTLGTVRIEL